MPTLTDHGERQPGPQAAPGDTAVAVSTALALLVWNNLVAGSRSHARHYVGANLLGTAVLLAVARLRGIRACDLGMSPERIAAGGRGGAAAGGMVLAALATVALSPSRRPLLRDVRMAGMSGRAVAYHAAVRVPLGTVVWEETAFRAVLPVLLQRVMPARTARVANSVLFGLWHVRPTLDALRLNGAPTRGPRGIAALASAVLASGLADVVLSRLQRSTGSLLAPILVHVASNSGGTVAAWPATRGRCPDHRARMRAGAPCRSLLDAMTRLRRRQARTKAGAAAIPATSSSHRRPSAMS